METAGQVVSDILKELIISNGQQSITAFDFNSAVRVMNRYMAQLDADGVSLGYTEVTNAADPITIAPGAINGLIYNVAVQLAPQYDIAIDPVLVSNAIESLKVMRKIAMTVYPMSFPDTLPVGSGNEYNNGYDDKFYPPQPETVNDEMGGVIQLESGTENDN